MPGSDCEEEQAGAFPRSPMMSFTVDEASLLDFSSLQSDKGRFCNWMGLSMAPNSADPSGERLQKMIESFKRGEHFSDGESALDMELGVITFKGKDGNAIHFPFSSLKMILEKRKEGKHEEADEVLEYMQKKFKVDMVGGWNNCLQLADALRAVAKEGLEFDKAQLAKELRDVADSMDLSAMPSSTENHLGFKKFKK
jgi:hypothetical protein